MKNLKVAEKRCNTETRLFQQQISNCLALTCLEQAITKNEKQKGILKKKLHKSSEQ